MAQPSVIQFFNSRKRQAVEEFNRIDKKRKLLKVDQKGSNVTPNLNTSVCSNVKTERQNSGLPSQCKNNQTSELDCVKNSILKSDKLKALKESIKRFKKSEEQLKVVEKRTEEIFHSAKSEINTTILDSPKSGTKTAEIRHSPKLETFRSIEIEISVSPQKTHSPEKPYLSPKRKLIVRKNLFNVSSPIRNLGASTNDQNLSGDVTDSAGSALQLPFKYRTLNEFFRAIETIAQILYNRKESITFEKLKPAVEEMVKRNFLLKHLAQIKFIYPDAYQYKQQKIVGTKFEQVQWELVLTPVIDVDVMTTQVIVERRRKFQQALVDKVKLYHNDFLLSLIPPINVSTNQITRWHPEFDIEKVPDIESADLPQPRLSEKNISGKEVLENARRLFNCNNRMNHALLNIKQLTENKLSQECTTNSDKHLILNNLPKALLEKVRQKQATKALMCITRTKDKEKKMEMYCRLPEIARLIRNMFVTERKAVLELDIVIEKLGNSYRTSLGKNDIEEHLETISKELPQWLVFHKLRHSVFLKLDKNADLSTIITKLEKLAKEQ